MSTRRMSMQTRRLSAAVKRVEARPRAAGQAERDLPADFEGRLLCRRPTHPATVAPGVHEYPRATSPPAHADCKNSFRRPGAPRIVARPIRHRIGPAIGAPGAGGRSARGRGRAPGRRRPTTETVASRCIVLSRRRAVQAWHGSTEPDSPINAKRHPHLHAVLARAVWALARDSVLQFGRAVLLPPAAPTSRGPHRVHHHRPQADAPLLPHAAQHRPSGLRGSSLSAIDQFGGRAGVHQPMFCDQLPATLLLPATLDSRPRTSGRTSFVGTPRTPSCSRRHTRRRAPR